MKKLAIAIAVLAVIAGIVCYNIWRAYQDPVTTPPTLVELGRQQLHQQLLDSEKREAEIEQADWNTVTLLEDLIKAHQTRIDKLNGNSQADEIIAHDKAAIARLQKRIADLQEQQRAQPTEEAAPGAEGATPLQPGSESNGTTQLKPQAATSRSNRPAPQGATAHPPGTTSQTSTRKPETGPQQH